MILVMVGAPGAGKGTQAQVLAARLGIPHVASGELFRAAVHTGTTLGRTVAGYLEQGALVPDKVATAVILERLRESDAAGGAILDGFPRTRPQAEALDVALGRMGKRVAQALYVGVREAELRRRLSGRWLCRASDHIYHAIDRPPRRPGICDIDGSELYQRPDDRPETVQARLAAQLPPMYEVVDYYTERGVLTAVDGEGPVDEVSEALLRAVAQPIR
ncbi:MAG TPA: nucleoside monophosphate kinase [Candidatus Baltobacteraceae bacterium]|nr:nucleoside monophosphate kinase [Candidatus Baltobacteraceae bacterium]